MAEFGITNTGFKTKRLDQLLSELNAEMKTIFGENFNVSPETPDGQVNGSISESNANLWEIAQIAYDSFNPSAASGVALSSLVQLNAITRQEATQTTAIGTVTGTTGTTIPSGSLISTTSGSITFSTDAEITIPISGIIEANLTATVTGPLEASAGTITEIDTPIVGWDAITNNTDAVVGRNEETDPELRSRREKSILRTAISPLDSIIAEVLAVPEVTYSAGFENITDVIDSRNLPPHSIRIVADGGIGDEIAQAIHIKKAIGISTSGNTTGDAVDSQGVIKIISFSRPDPITIHVRVDIDTFPDFPDTGIEDIKRDIVDYVNGDLVVGKGFGAAEDVIRTELFTPINKTIGLSVSLLVINTTGSPGPGDINNIEISFEEKSEFLEANIEVNIL